jgi:hypothetical protein
MIRWRLGNRSIIGRYFVPLKERAMTRTSLNDVLQRRKESYEAEAVKNKDIIDEWVQAIGRLFAQLREWMVVLDPQRILKIEEGKTEINEPNIGRYHAPRLDIRGLGKWVGIIPKARKTVGAARPPRPDAPAQATGRVDITDEIRRYVLYRFEYQDEDSWFIEGPSSDAPEELTQERFEEALMSYFQ